MNVNISVFLSDDNNRNTLKKEFQLTYLLDVSFIFTLCVLLFTTFRLRKCLVEYKDRTTESDHRKNSTSALDLQWTQEKRWNFKWKTKKKQNHRKKKQWRVRQKKERKKECTQVNWFKLNYSHLEYMAVNK